jgi:hypothetical protein
LTRRYVAIGTEASYGVAPGVNLSGLKVTSVNETFDPGLIFEETCDSQTINNAYGGAQKYTGTIEAFLRPAQMGPLFQCLFGVPTGGVYTLAATPKSMTMEICTDDNGIENAIRYLGVGISSMEMNLNAREAVTTRWNYFAKSSSKVPAQASVAYPKAEPALFWGATVTLRSGASTTIKSMTMNIERGLDPDDFVVGHSQLQGLVINAVPNISGSITLSQREWTEFQRALYADSGTSTYAPRTTRGDTSSHEPGQTNMTLLFKDRTGTPICQVETDVAVYTDASRSMRGRAGVEKTVNYRVIGDTFEFVEHDV